MTRYIPLGSVSHADYDYNNFILPSIVYLYKKPTLLRQSTHGNVINKMPSTGNCRAQHDPCRLSAISALPANVADSTSVHHGCGYRLENSQQTCTLSNRGCMVKGTHRTWFICGCIRYTVSGKTPHGSQQPVQLLLFHTILYMYYCICMNISMIQCTVWCAVLLFCCCGS
jgi:hypothetical protein